MTDEYNSKDFFNPELINALWKAYSEIVKPFIMSEFYKDFDFCKKITEVPVLTETCDEFRFTSEITKEGIKLFETDSNNVNRKEIIFNSDSCEYDTYISIMVYMFFMSLIRAEAKNINDDTESACQSKENILICTFFCGLYFKYSNSIRADIGFPESYNNICISDIILKDMDTVISLVLRFIVIITGQVVNKTNTTLNIFGKINSDWYSRITPESCFERFGLFEIIFEFLECCPVSHKNIFIFLLYEALRKSDDARLIDVSVKFQIKDVVEKEFSSVIFSDSDINNEMENIYYFRKNVLYTFSYMKEKLIGMAGNSLKYEITTSVQNHMHDSNFRLSFDRNLIINLFRQINNENPVVAEVFSCSPNVVTERSFYLFYKFTLIITGNIQNKSVEISERKRNGITPKVHIIGMKDIVKCFIVTVKIFYNLDYTEIKVYLKKLSDDTSCIELLENDNLIIEFFYNEEMKKITFMFSLIITGFMMQIFLKDNDRYFKKSREKLFSDMGISVKLNKLIRLMNVSSSEKWITEYIEDIGLKNYDLFVNSEVNENISGRASSQIRDTYEKMNTVYNSSSRKSESRNLQDCRNQLNKLRGFINENNRALKEQPALKENMNDAEFRNQEKAAFFQNNDTGDIRKNMSVILDRMISSSLILFDDSVSYIINEYPDVKNFEMPEKKSGLHDLTFVMSDDFWSNLLCELENDERKIFFYKETRDASVIAAVRYILFGKLLIFSSAGYRKFIVRKDERRLFNVEMRDVFRIYSFILGKYLGYDMNEQSVGKVIMSDASFRNYVNENSDKQYCCIFLSELLKGFVLQKHIINPEISKERDIINRNICEPFLKKIYLLIDDDAYKIAEYFW